MARRVARSPEHRFLVACICTDERAAEPLLGGALQWDEVLRLASWHRLAPLLSRRLAAMAARTRVPHRVMDQLEAAYLENAARNAYLAAELRRAAAALEAAGVVPMLLKGAALVDDVYDDPAVRPMFDLDLLVREPGLRAAQAVIKGLGYRTADSVPDGHHRLPVLVSEDGWVVFELHRHLSVRHGARRLDLSAFWSRARPASVPGALLPAPEDLVSHVAIHFFFDRWYRADGALGQLVDVATTVARHGDDLDWEELVAGADRGDVGTPVFFGLALAREMLGAAVPDDVLGALRPRRLGGRTERWFVDRRVLSSSPWPALQSLSPPSLAGMRPVGVAVGSLLHPRRAGQGLFDHWLNRRMLSLCRTTHRPTRPASSSTSSSKSSPTASR